MTRVFIGNLREDCREKDIEELFRDYGRITDIFLKGTFGFVNFDEKRDASDAIKDLDGERFDGRRIQVEYAKGGGLGRDGERGRGGGDRGGDSRGGDRGRERRGGGGGRRTDYRLIVENLSSRTSWQDLKDYMRKAGEVVYTDTDGYNREGVVEFQDRRDMERALRKLDDTELDGRWIKLREEGRSRRRDRSRSRSRSGERRRGKNKDRSRSGSKSRSRSGDRKKERERSRSRGRRDESRSRSRSGSNTSRSRSRSNSRSSTRSRDHH